MRTFQFVKPLRGLTAIDCATLGALYGSSRDRPAGIAAAHRLAILRDERLWA